MLNKLKFKSVDYKSFTSIIFLIIIAFAYCAPALVAPFWGTNDTWSNLLPIIHYRISILDEHTLPLYTKLWYGGRYQWQNPLWSFLYFPATIIWLITPLDWGTRIVYSGHLIFSLLAGRKLSSLFLTNEVGRFSTAVIFTSPMLPALLAGHLEKVMAWGWLLFSIYFLFDEKKSLHIRGVYSGLCWGIIALAGANYHILYAGILLLPLVLSFKKLPLLISFVGGASIGLLHLPSIWYLIGVARSNPIQSIKLYSIDFTEIPLSLAFGISRFSWESWALVGIPMLYLFIQSLGLDIKNVIIRHIPPYISQKFSLLLSVLSLSLLATGSLYKGHHLLDTFRVPVRAISLIAVIIVLYVLISLKSSQIISSNKKQENINNFLLAISVIQISIMALLFIRPLGTYYNQNNTEAQNLANLLQKYQAKSVWLSKFDFNDMHLHGVLTQNGIALPNTYYGDMGQTIPIQGPYCGYSFDFLVGNFSENVEEIELVSDMTNQVLAKIPTKNLQYTDQFTFQNRNFSIYRVVCK